MNSEEKGRLIKQQAWELRNTQPWQGKSWLGVSRSRSGRCWEPLNSSLWAPVLLSSLSREAWNDRWSPSSLQQGSHTAEGPFGTWLGPASFPYLQLMTRRLPGNNKSFIASLFMFPCYFPTTFLLKSGKLSVYALQPPKTKTDLRSLKNSFSWLKYSIQFYLYLDQIGANKVLFFHLKGKLVPVLSTSAQVARPDVKHKCSTNSDHVRLFSRITASGICVASRAQTSYLSTGL